VLVEFAIVVPFLFLIVFGIIEFGWGFGQYLDVRHGAREGARLAAVNYSDPEVVPPSSGATQTQEILAEVCDRMGGDVNGATITLSFDVTGSDDLGDRARIVMDSELDTLTGFLDVFLEGRDINDEISFRLEQDATWIAGSRTCS
jgi:Flp pilus assembly protein TadG